LNLCRADKVLLGGGAALASSAALFGASSLGLALPAAAFVALLMDGVFRPSSSTLYSTVSHGSRNEPKVALTFDDGPDPEVTPRVLDLLREYDARATFFMIGHLLEQASDIGDRAAREGHEIGNHSWQHSYVQNFFSTRAHLDDIERSERLIRRVAPSDVSPLFRAPVGFKSPELARAAHARSLKIIAWSIHSRDTIDRNPRRIAERVLRRIQPGDIVLMHDGHPTAGAHRRQVIEALPLILAGLRTRGLQAVTVSDLSRSS
jgi:peptidoglycan-N-acetylglucosamine deacetylase